MTDNDSRMANDLVDTRQSPRWSIAHLLIAVAAIGAGLVIVRSLFGGEPEIVATVGESLRCLFLAIALIGLTVWPIACYRKNSYPLEPGHWLLIWIGLEVAFYWLVHAGFLVSSDVFRDPIWRWQAMNDFLFAQASMMPCLAMFGLLVAYFRIRGFAWKIAFGVLACQGLAASVVTFSWAMRAQNEPLFSQIMFLSSVERLLGVSALIAIVAALLLDRYSDSRRDWAHRLGVGTYFVCEFPQLAAPMITTIVLSLLRGFFWN